MNNSAMLNGGLLCIVILMTLLLGLFLFTVVSAELEPAGPAGSDKPPPLPRPAPVPPVPPPPAPLPARQRPPLGAAATAAQPGNGVYAARHAGALAPEQDVVYRPKVSGGPPWGPAPKPPGVP